MIRFVPETHQYFDGDKELISVTTLMQKHHLAPDYSKVDKDVVQAKAERGTLIHKEIEDWIKNGEVGFTEELQKFKDWAESAGISTFQSETIVHNDICAGTVDLMFESDGVAYIADIKTTYQIHNDAVSWQLSIYNYLDGWKADVGQVFHFDEKGNLAIETIALKKKEEVETLLNCERNGEIYQFNPLSIVTKNEIAEILEAENLIIQADKMKKQGEERMKKITESLKKAMIENGVYSFSTDKLTITLVKAYTKETFDGKKFKEESPELYAKYKKTSEVPPSLRISVKD